MTADSSPRPASAAAPGAFCCFDRRLTALRGFKRQAAGFILGALAALALPPVCLLPIMFISLPGFVRLLDGVAAQKTADALSRRRAAAYAALTGWAFGFGYFTAGLWWLADAMTVDLAKFGWAIPFAVFGLPAFLALYWGLAAALASLLWRRGLARLAALAVAFALGEYLRGVLFTGFPWSAVSLTAMPCPLLMQADGLLGQNIMNGLAVFTFSLPALWLGRQSAGGSFNSRAAAKFGAVLGLALIAADCAYGFYALRAAPAPLPAAAAGLRIRIVQPGIAQADKQDENARADAFHKLLALTKAPPKAGGQMPQLIIWPETAVPYLLEYNPPALAAIGAALKPGQLLLTGAIRTEKIPIALQPDGGREGDDARLTDRYHFYNSMLLIDSRGQIIAHADKAHLVPFGEYLPLGNIARRFGFSGLAEAGGPYSAVSSRHLLPLPQGVSALPLICYEAIFPHEVQSAKKQANLIVNITNDAWFGATPGPYQHLAQARLRAVETGLPLIRAANTGISAYIDGHGRIKAELGLNKSGFLDIALDGRRQ